MSLVAYIDESGTHDVTGRHPGSEVATVMGYVSWKEDWDRFCIEWQRVLDSESIGVFHMSECVDKLNGPSDPDWPYQGWTDERRDKFVRSLIQVALDNTLFAVGGSVNVRDYDRLMPDWLKMDAEHPYHFCSQLFFNSLLPMLEKFSDRPLPEGEQVAFFFEQNPTYEPRVTKAFHLIKALRDKKDRFGSFTFATKKQHKQLQAADLLAYVVRQQQARRIKEGIEYDGTQFPVVTGSWEDLLISRRNVNAAYFDASNLQKMIIAFERDRLRILSSRNGQGPVTAEPS